MSKIKIAIIGVGNISECHIKGYMNNPDAELYAFCDLDSGRLHEMGEKYGVTRLFTDFNEMLALKEIDAVSVCTWNSSHAPCTIAALNAGKHVLCEKPMAINAAEGQAMKEAADKNNKLLMIGFVRRFGEDCLLVEDLAQSGEIGEIYYGKAQYLRRNGNPGGWFGDKARSGGGPLVDLGVHVIDLTRYLMGNRKPVSVYGAAYQKLFDRPHIKAQKGYLSTTKTDKPICDVEDLALGIIRYDNGSTVFIETSFSLDVKSDSGKIELYSDKGGVTINPDVTLTKDRGGHMTNQEFASPTSLYPVKTGLDGLFAKEIDHFVDCVKTGRECRCPAEDGIEVMKILDALYKSAETGHEVVLD